MLKDLSPDKYDAILRSDLGYFAERCCCAGHSSISSFRVAQLG
jgi:hypothetical protein